MSVQTLVEQARRNAGIPQELGPSSHPSINALFADAVSRFGDLPVLSALGHTIDFRTLDRLSAAFAAWLQHHTDLQPGDRIAIQLPNLLQIGRAHV